MTHFALLSDPVMRIEVQWPSGKYALPQAKDGCPANDWLSGWRYQDNEDDNNANSYDPSNVNNYLRIDTGRNLKTYYCTKTFSSGNGFTWPKGNYCIARYGGSCPSDFSSGSIHWDDEDDKNANGLQRPIPDGDYGRNTKIQYCCRSDGSANSEIMLPPTNDFILYRYNGVCQRVKCMDTRQLKIHFDDEDSKNANSCSGAHPDNSVCSRNHDIYMCHYNTKNKC